MSKYLAWVPDNKNREAAICIEVERNGVYEHETNIVQRAGFVEIWAKEGVEIGHRHKSKQLMDIS